ncbi:MAG: hypothetical protein IPL65_13350 [Lewinellaceae bacterium]|nr:hypothetical protein [Lewinellaceae bacterium]
MENNSKREHELEKTLNSLDDLQRVPGNPWLYTRLQERRKQAAQPRGFWKVPALQGLAFASLLLVNVFTVISGLKATNTHQDKLVQTVSEQFGLESSIQNVDLFNIPNAQ